MTDYAVTLYPGDTFSLTIGSGQAPEDAPNADGPLPGDPVAVEPDTTVDPTPDGTPDPATPDPSSDVAGSPAPADPNLALGVGPQ